MELLEETGMVTPISPKGSPEFGLGSFVPLGGRLGSEYTRAWSLDGRFWCHAGSDSKDESVEGEGVDVPSGHGKYWTSPMEEDCRTLMGVSGRSLVASGSRS